MTGAVLDFAGRVRGAFYAYEADEQTLSCAGRSFKPSTLHLKLRAGFLRQAILPTSTSQAKEHSWKRPS